MDHIYFLILYFQEHPIKFQKLQGKQNWDFTKNNMISKTRHPFNIFFSITKLFRLAWIIQRIKADGVCNQVPEFEETLVIWGKYLKYDTLVTMAEFMERQIKSTGSFEFLMFLFSKRQFPTCSKIIFTRFNYYESGDHTSPFQGCQVLTEG